MGYFSFGAINFIYKIYRSKKFRKFLIGFGFLAFVLFTIFNNTTFATTDWGGDTSAILNQQIKFNNDMIELFDGCIHTLESGNGTVVNNGGTPYTLESFQQLFKSYFANNPAFRKGWFYGDSSTNGLWFQSWSSVSSSGEVTSGLSDYYGTYVPSDIYHSITWQRCSSNGWTFYIKITNNGYQCDFTFNTAHTFNVPTDVYLNSSQDIDGVNILTQSGVGLIAHVWDYFMSGNILNDNIGVINTNQEINQSVEEQTDFLNQDSDTGVVDDITNTLVDDTTDITEDGWNSIFTLLKSKMTTNAGIAVDFPIPFTDKTMRLTPTLMYGGKYAELQNSVLGQIILSFWWFVFGLYVYKDISKIINKVKSGNIEGIENSNIKEDLL